MSLALIVCAGVRLPEVSAASARNGLMVEPGWRCACVARLKLDIRLSKPP